MTAPDGGRRPVALIGAPYHLGRRGVGMGAGPEVLLAAGGAPDRLAAAGVEAHVEWIEDAGGPDHEVGRVFELNRRLAESVGDALAGGAFALVAAGNCNASLGVLGGIGQAGLGEVGIVWFDAHADFHTPETTTSGFLDGMGLAIVTGSCWRSLRGSVPGFRAVAEEAVVLAGVRDLEPREAERLRSSGVVVVEGGRIAVEGVAGALGPELDRLRARVPAVYLHVDLDVLDPSEGRANEYAAPGGLALHELSRAIAAVAERFAVPAAAVTAYDPACDTDGRMRHAATEVLEAVASCAGAANG